MSAPGEHKTVHARILKYAHEIGWTYVPRAEAEERRGFDPAGATPEERARKASLFFGDLPHAQVRAFHPPSSIFTPLSSLLPPPSSFLHLPSSFLTDARPNPAARRRLRRHRPAAPGPARAIDKRLPPS